MKRTIAGSADCRWVRHRSLLAVPAARAADVFTLTSSAVQDNGALATKNACSDKQRTPELRR